MSVRCLRDEEQAREFSDISGWASIVFPGFGCDSFFNQLNDGFHAFRSSGNIAVVRPNLGGSGSLGADFRSRVPAKFAVKQVTNVVYAKNAAIELLRRC